MDLFTLVAKLTMDASEYEKGITKSKQSFMGLANTVSAKAVAVGTMVAHGVEKAAKSLIDFGKNAIQASADIEAEIALYHQVFGELESAATGALESISQDTNILSTRLRGIGTSAFMQFKGAGVDAGNAISMMDKYTRLAADAAAAYNISIEEADVKLRSFIRGNTEAGDSIGLFTSEAQRNERAMATYKKKWQQLTEAQKQMLMLNVVDEIYKQQEIIGQAAREGHEWENVIGNLNRVFTDLSGTVGSSFREKLIPVIEKLTEFFSDETVVMRIGMLSAGFGDIAGKAFDGAIDFIDRLLKWSTGEEQMSDSAQSLMDILSSLGNVASMVFTGAYDFVKLLFNGMDEKTSQNIEEFLEDFSAFVDSPGFQTAATVLGGIFTAFLALNAPLLLVGLALGAIVTHWKDIKEWADKAWKSFKSFIDTVIPDDFMEKASDAWDNVKSKVDGAWQSVKDFLAQIIPEEYVQSIIDKWDTINGWINTAWSSILSFLETVMPEGFMSGVVSVMETISGLVNGISSTWNAFLGSLESGRAQQGIANVQSAMESGGIGSAIKAAVEQSWWGNLIQGGKTSTTDYDLTIGEHGAGASFATGLDYVPYNNFFARLHEGEAVLTKAEASQWRSGGSVQSIDYSAIGSAVGSAVREALSGVGVYMGADRVGDLVTERVSRNIARDARNRRYQPV